MLITLCLIILVITAESSSQESFTWKEAFNKCQKNYGYLESDIKNNEYGPYTQFQMSQSSTWIGSVELHSKWLEIKGCFYINNTTSGFVDNVKTIANCEMECTDFDFFAYRTGENSVCKCIQKVPYPYTAANTCENTSSYRFLVVYGRYNKSKFYEKEKENCMFIYCTPPTILTGPKVANCASHIAHGVCGNNIAIDNWNLDWHGSLKQCINKYGTYFLNNFRHSCSFITAPSWTNIFRQQESFYYDFHSQKDNIENHQLTKCAAIGWDATNRSWKKTYIDCNTRLQSFFCQKGEGLLSTAKQEKEQTTEMRQYVSTLFFKSTTLHVSARKIQSTKITKDTTNTAITKPGMIWTTDLATTKIENNIRKTEKRQDVILGSVIGGITVVVGVSIFLLVCKIRLLEIQLVQNQILHVCSRLSRFGIINIVVCDLLFGTSLCRSFGIFSKKKDHSVMKFSRETSKGSDQSTPMKNQPHIENKRNGARIQKTKDTYAQVIKPHKTENNMLYSVVNKTRKLSTGKPETDDSYSEFSEGEYDRLNNFDRRILNKDSNMYDSSVGIRNFKDPMYDTTLNTSRFEGEDVYDHSFPNVNTDSNYDCSSSFAHTNMKENDVYDKSV